MEYTIQTLIDSFPRTLIGAREYEGAGNCKPYTTEIHSIRTVGISTGYAALFLNNIVAPTDLPHYPDVGKIFAGLTSNKYARKVVSFEALKTWTMVHGWALEYKQRSSQVCMECRGKGVVECNYYHEHDCEECDGAGRITIVEGWALSDDVTKNPAILGKIADYAVINRRYLATCIRLLEADTVEICTGTEYSDPVIILAGDWTAVVMPIHADDFTTYDTFKE